MASFAVLLHVYLLPLLPLSPHPVHGVRSRRTCTAWFDGVLSQLARRVEHALRVRRDRVCRAAEDLGPVDRVVADGEEGRVLLHAQLDGGRRAQVHLGVGLGSRRAPNPNPNPIPNPIPP